MKIHSISYSRRKVWNTCKLQYVYQYHDKLKADFDPIYYKYGRLIHDAADAYVKNEGKVEIWDLFAGLMGGDTLPKDYMARHRGDLQKVVDFHKRVGFGGKTEMKLEGKLHGTKLLGYVDRVLPFRLRADAFERGGIWIIDYKTGSSRNPSVFQLKMYALMSQLKWKVPAPEIDVSFLFLQDGAMVTRTFSQKVLDSTAKALYTTFEEIAAFEAPEDREPLANVGFHCRYCSFRKTCPYYQYDSIGESLWGDQGSLREGMPNVIDPSFSHTSQPAAGETGSVSEHYADL